MKTRDGQRGDTYVVEGHWAVAALLDHDPSSVVEVLIESGRHAELRDRCEALSLPYRELSGEEIAKSAGYFFHRGVYAIAERPQPRELDETFIATARRILVPIDIADAGNLGTLIRTAVAFGADGVVIEKGRGVDAYSRKCIRSSATAIFQIPIYEVVSLTMSLERLIEAGVILLGASLSESSRALPEVEGSRRLAILLGSEGSGLPEEIEEQCAELVRIPMQEGIDSLNVAVSGGILMWEWFGRELHEPLH